MYVRDKRLPAALVERVPWAYRASFRKFYMDEFYEVAVIRPVINGANWLWVFFDTKVIDGTVNGIAALWGWLGAHVAAAADGARAELRLRHLRRGLRARHRLPLGVGRLTVSWQDQVGFPHPLA